MVDMTDLGSATYDDRARQQEDLRASINSRNHSGQTSQRRIRFQDEVLLDNEMMLSTERSMGTRSHKETPAKGTPKLRASSTHSNKENSKSLQNQQDTS